MLNRIRKYFSKTEHNVKSQDDSDVSSFLSFLIESPEAAAYRDELLPRIQNFQSKSASRQAEELPGLYLYVEKYIFKSSDLDLNSFRKLVGKHFKTFIQDHPDFQIIFLPYDQQVIELCNRFLLTVSKRFDQFLGNSADTSWGALSRWLTQRNTKQPSEFETVLEFTQVDLKNLQFPQYVRLSQDFFNEVEKRFNTGFVLTHYNEAYEELSVKFQNLDAFHELIKLFPNKTLDESKLNILSIQQIKELLLEKVQNLEKISSELLNKNEELNAQSELLNQQNKKLQDAQTIIELKNKELSEYSANLEHVVEKRTLELETTNEILKQYNKNLEDHAFAISHHVKAPVSRIMGLINLLNNNTGEVEEDKVMGMLEESVHELNDILAELVHVLNIKKDASHMIVESCDLAEIITRIAEELKKSHQTHARVSVSVGNSAVVRTDRKYITQALHHILDNCFKFRRPDQELAIETQIELFQNFTRISISDNGLGFPLERVKEKLFNPFQRFNTHAAGKGLGLYFANQLVSVLNGSISIESSVDKGTQVGVTLPVYPNV